MGFEFATAARIVFGQEGLDGLLEWVGERRVLVVTGSRAERAAPVLERLVGGEYALFQVGGEPSLETAVAGVEQAREAGAEVVIGVGGGSAIDAGKAIAALLTNGGQPLDYLEVIGKGQKLHRASAPYAAIPTTAGTGAEVTRNAVLASPEHRVKVSMRSPSMLPQLALVVPELTHSMPRSLTASTGLDALTQVIEPFVSRLANPLTDALCREGIQRAARSLRRAYREPDDASARRDMALASLLGGLALANAKLGAVHGFAGPMGGMYPAPHGVLCARFLPHVMECNLRALQSRAKDSPILGRFKQLAQLLTGDDQASAADGVGWIQRLCEDLEFPALSQFGVDTTEADALIQAARRSSSMKGNPIELNDEELFGLLERAIA